MLDLADRQRILDKALTGLRKRRDAGDLTEAQFNELQARAIEWEQREARRRVPDPAGPADLTDVDAAAEAISAGVARFVQFVGELDIDFDFDFDFD